MKLRGKLDGAAFRLRNRLRMGRNGYQEVAQPKDELYSDRQNEDALMAAENRLLTRYPLLVEARARSRRARYLEILSVADYIERLWGDRAFPSARPLRWLDVGAKNWAYVDALAAFVSAHTLDYQLDGVEIDPWRLYRDLYTRRAYAMAYIQPYPQARYLEGDVLDCEGTYDVVTLLLPFVLPSPHAAWGLPLEGFRPQALLDHIVERLLTPTGSILILNQGCLEAEAQRALLQPHLEQGRLEAHCLGELPPTFLSYRYPRFGWRCQGIARDGDAR
ncbi:MAG: hypothetical protein IPK79_11640 [Vampirovibrionales bacterium]|nr:hypothetical protein [Vampirovibrionales bacterium]